MSKGFDTTNGKATNIIVKYISKQKNIKCIRCNKKVCVNDGCADAALKGFGKLKSFSSMPFGLLSGMFADSSYSILCNSCDRFVKRSIGFIPEIWDSKWFPQVSTTGLTLEVFEENMKSKTKKKLKWEIRYQGKTFPNTKKLYKEFMDSAIEIYKLSYPSCPHSAEKLKKLINSHKLYDKRYPLF